MAKSALTTDEQFLYNVVMGRRNQDTGVLLSNTIGQGKGLSTNREENVVKHLVEPPKHSKRPSLADAAVLIQIGSGDQTVYTPFDLNRFYDHIRRAQSHGPAGDGVVQVLWDPNKLAEVTGGAPGNWTAWTRLALGVKGRKGHHFLPSVKMSSLDTRTFNFLLDKGIIQQSRRPRTRPLPLLTTTAMCAYMMAQTRWPEETLVDVQALQRCIHDQADHIIPLGGLVKREIIPVADPAIDQGQILLELNDLSEPLDVNTALAAVVDEDHMSEASVEAVGFEREATMALVWWSGFPCRAISACIWE